jgi:hypothetical protein
MDSHLTQAVAAERIAERGRTAADWRLARQAARRGGTPEQATAAQPGRTAALVLTAGFHWLAARRLVSEQRQTRPLAD